MSIYLCPRTPSGIFFRFTSLTGCGSTSDDKNTADNKKTEESKTIEIAAFETPHSEILAKAKDILKEQGYDLEVTFFETAVSASFPFFAIQNRYPKYNKKTSRRIIPSKRPTTPPIPCTNNNNVIKIIRGISRNIVVRETINGVMTDEIPKIIKTFKMLLPTIFPW